MVSSLLSVHHGRRQPRLSSPRPQPPASHLHHRSLSLSYTPEFSPLVHTRRRPSPPSSFVVYHLNHNAV
ncbi:hypothetical protein L195_g033169 [Trifolium pratense]|uniref:Uncharacterized protein n=1 Tax=Trifolium pratense TaxID=57577 RepID=A0A2K3LFA3_TRIPR|nr:hypothetical protein L195_g033169 [Trifolium pratense]